MKEFAPLLGPRQVFSGKCDPVTVVQDGGTSDISESVRNSQEQAGGRCIVSAGCEITPGTTCENFRALRAAAGQCTMSIDSQRPL